MIRKIVSAALSAAICVTGIFSGCSLKSTDSHEREGAGISSPSDNGYDLRSTNSLGEFIADSQPSNNMTQLANKAIDASDADYAVTFLEFEKETGKVTVVSDQPYGCKLVVSVIDEEADKAAIVKDFSLSAGRSVKTERTLDINGLPECFIVKAQLFDSFERAVGNEFIFSRYTKKVQEIIAADITEFDEDRVVNFDEDETTNFIVLSDDTIKAESSAEVNSLISADYENNTFVFGNADESILGLECGDDFYIQPDEKNLIAIRVDAVECDGDTVTVKGENNVDEILEFAKIETVVYYSNIKIDPTNIEVINSGEKSDFQDLTSCQRKFAVPSHNINSEPQNVGKEISECASASIKFNEISGMIDDGLDGSSAGYGISGGMNISFKFNYFKKAGFNTVDLMVLPEVSLSLSCKSECEISIPLPGPDGIPTAIPLLDIGLSPSIVLNIAGEVGAELKYAPVFGISYNSDNGLQTKADYGIEHLSTTFEIKAEVFIGIETFIGLYYIDPDICSIGVNFGLGLSLPAELTVSDSDNYFADAIKASSSGKVCKYDSVSDTLHKCRVCMHFYPSVKAYAENSVKFLKFSAEKNIFELNIKLPFLKSHYSIPYGFGWGECNNYRHKALFIVNDIETDNRVPDAKITVDGVEVITDSNGEAYLFCDDGNYGFSVEYKGTHRCSSFFDINGSGTTISIKINEKDKTKAVIETSTSTTTTTTTHTTMTTIPATTYTFAIPDNQVICESGMLGDHIGYLLYPDGYLDITGYGEMYDFSRSPFSNPSKVKEVIIENVGDEEDEIITSIGNGVFNNCTDLESITMPHTIKRIGNYAFANCTSFSKIIFAEYLDKETGKVKPKEEISEGILAFSKDLETIGDYAFYNCPLFKEIVYSRNIIDIGSYAFADCIGITEVTIPETIDNIGVYAFSNCTSLKKAEIFGCTGEIGHCIFSGCESLEELTLPFAGFNQKSTDNPNTKEVVTSYFNAGNNKSYYGFINYEGLGVCIPNTLKTINILGGTRIPNYAFTGLAKVEYINLPDTITEIGNNAFDGCTALANRYTLSGITSIGNEAFKNCGEVDFKDLVFAKNIKFIGTRAFENCKGITSITIPEAVETIGDRAFENCTSIKKATISGCTGTIGHFVFSGCASLEELTIPFVGFSKDSADDPENKEVVTSYFNVGDGKNYYDFSNYEGYGVNIPITLKTINVLGGNRISDFAFAGMKNVETINIPDTITEIGNNAFDGCTALASRYTLSGITSIGNEAFKNCGEVDFKDLVFAKNIKFIGTRAFENCKGITSITIPEAVETIGDRAFENCTSIKKATISGCTGTIGHFVFSGCASLEELTIPFVGFSKELADDPKNKEVVSSYFNVGDVKNYYGFSNYEGYGVNIPITLKTINVLGGNRISDFAFAGMKNVETVTIPKSITEIADNAFNGCSGIENVYYPSTREEWEKNVTVGKNNEAIYGKVRFLNDNGDIAVTTMTTGTAVSTTTTSKAATTTTVKTTTAATPSVTTSSKAVATTTSAATTTKTSTKAATTSSTTVTTTASKTTTAATTSATTSSKAAVTTTSAATTTTSSKAATTSSTTVTTTASKTTTASTTSVASSNKATTTTSATTTTTSIKATTTSSTTVTTTASKTTTASTTSVASSNKAITTSAATTTTTSTKSVLTSSTIVTTTASKTTTAATTSAVTSSKLVKVIISNTEASGEKDIQGVEMVLSGKNDKNEPITFKDGQISVAKDGTAVNGVGTSLVWIAGSEETEVYLEDGTYTLTELADSDSDDEPVIFTVKNGNITVESKNEDIALIVSTATSTTLTTTMTQNGTNTSKMTATTVTTVAPSAGTSNTTATSSVSATSSTIITAVLTTTTSTVNTTITATSTLTTSLSNTTAAALTATTTSAVSSITNAVSTTTTSIATTTASSVTTSEKADTTISITSAAATSTVSEPVTTITTAATQGTSEEITLGDVNRDGLINAVDASTTLTYYAMISTNKDGGFDDTQKAAADVNFDGAINAIDASCILSYYAYISTTKESVLSLKDFLK